LRIGVIYDLQESKLDGNQGGRLLRTVKNDSAGKINWQEIYWVSGSTRPDTANFDQTTKIVCEA